MINAKIFNNRPFKVDANKMNLAIAQVVPWVKTGLSPEDSIKMVHKLYKTMMLDVKNNDKN